MKVDFHVHTTYSDGIYSVEEVLQLASNKNLKILAFTDHDNIDAYEHALKIKTNIQLICGVELSTIYENKPVHILGYFLNNEVPIALNNFFKELKHERDVRALKIIEKLKEVYKIEIDLKEVEKISKGVIGRPHLAQAIANKYGLSRNEVFERYLSNDSPVYLPPTVIDTKNGIELLKQNNAFVVLAHPSLIENLDLEIFYKMGIEGIELFHPANTKKDRKQYRKFIKEHNLRATAGSDFHGTYYQQIGTNYLLEPEIELFLNQLKKNH